MSDEVVPLSGAVDGMRMLKDGTIAVTLHFEPKDRAAVMAAMGEPGASIACVRLKDGHAAKGQQPGTTYRDLGPICREAIDLCNNVRFQLWVSNFRANKEQSADAAKAFILLYCNVTSRKELDTAEGARELFIAHVRKPFHQWLEKNP